MDNGLSESSEIVDKSPVLPLHETGQDQHALATAIVGHLSEKGYFFLTNHGIPDKVITNAFTAAKKFFELPIDVKKKYQRPRGVDDDTGYIPVNYEKLAKLDTAKAEAPSKELREAYNFFPYAKKKFPTDELPSFEKAMEALYKAALDVSMQLLELIITGLDLSPEKADILRQGHRYVGSEDNNTKMRILWYPSTKTGGATTRLGTHSDYGTITVLFQDETGGLESQSRDGQWVTVKPKSAVGKDGAVLIQIGDMFQHWTSGRLHSSKHRVCLTDQTQASNVRQSIALFLHPDNECVISQLDGETSERDISMGDFLKNRFSISYG